MNKLKIKLKMWIIEKTIPIWFRGLKKPRLWNVL